MNQFRKTGALLILSALFTCCGSCMVKNSDNEPSSTQNSATSADTDNAAEPSAQAQSLESPGDDSTAEATEPPPPQQIQGPAANAGKLVVGEDSCETDADCVPGGCCHPRTCVAKENAPSCEGTMCTLICLAGTLDCGGRCLCHEGKCAAKLSGPFVRAPKKDDQ